MGRTPIMISSSSSSERRLRWRWVAWRAGPLVILLAALAAGLALVPWIPLLPPAAGPATDRMVPPRLAGRLRPGDSVAALGRARPGGVCAPGAPPRVPRPIAARLWLLCASSLISLGGVELAAAVWLAWLHRLPVLPTRLAESPPDEASIVVIGESSARGYPYQPWLSVGQIVAWQLQQALPGRRFTVDVRARVGANLEQMHQALAKLTRRPDVLIIYCGHNEFLTRYDSARDAGAARGAARPDPGPALPAQSPSPLCRLIYETVNKNRLGGPPPRLHQHHLIDPPCMTPSESAAIVADFHRRLEAIVGYCERIGCVPVLADPARQRGGLRAQPLGPCRHRLQGRARGVDRVPSRPPAPPRHATPTQALAGYRAILASAPGVRRGSFPAGAAARGGWAHTPRPTATTSWPATATAIPSAARRRCRRPIARWRGGTAASWSMAWLYCGGSVPTASSTTMPSTTATIPRWRDMSRWRRRSSSPPRPVHVRLAQRARPRAPSTRPRPPLHFGIDNEKWVIVCARSATHYRDFSLDALRPHRAPGQAAPLRGGGPGDRPRGCPRSDRSPRPWHLRRRPLSEAVDARTPRSVAVSCPRAAQPCDPDLGLSSGSSW